MARPIQTLALLATLRSLLFLFNILFWTTGLAFLATGLWLGLKLHKYLELDRDLSSALPLFFTGLGLFVLLLSTLACQCAVKGAAPRLYIYSTLLFVVFLAEVCVLLIGYKFRTNVNAAFHDGLSMGLQEYGKVADRTAAIDDIQATLRCCGVSNFTDWQATPWGHGHGHHRLPHSCCQWTTDGVCSSQNHQGNKAHLYTTGCYRLVISFMVLNIRHLGLGVVVGAVVHVLGIVLACVLARNVSRAEYEELR